MARWELEVQVFPPFRRRLTQRWLRQVVEQTLKGENGEPWGTLTVVIADDDTLRRLNREYAGVDEVTDVLAFGSDVQGEEAGTGAGLTMAETFVIPAEVSPVMGDVVVSYPQAVRQARQHRHLVRREVALLVAHGVLHLLGYDHATPEQEREMEARQDRVLAQVL